MMNVCSIDGCDNPERKRSGLCGKHYQQKVRKRCSIDRCDSFRKKSGLCSKHYNQRFPKHLRIDSKAERVSRAEMLQLSWQIENDPKVANDFWEFVRKELAL